MTYAITGLAPDGFAPLFGLSDAELAARGVRRIVAEADGGYPCRVSLEDASAGERLLLVNHASNAVDGPYRSAFAIFVREQADQARDVDALPPVYESRPLSLRGYDAAGDLVALDLDDDHPHHAARGGVDVGRIRPRRKRRESEREQRGNGGENPRHGRVYGRAGFERKRRDARRSRGR